MINIKEWIRLTTWRLYSYLDTKYFILITLIGLHYSGKITDAKLKGQFSALRKGTLQKSRKIYHSTINDKWYNEDDVIEIWLDIAEGVTKFIPFEIFINYINKFENKGYNYALNVFGSEYLYPLFNVWNPEVNDINFSRFSGLELDGVVSYKDYSYTCYECGHTHSDISKNESENLERLDSWLHSKKKGNLHKIPKHNIKNMKFF